MKKFSHVSRREFIKIKNMLKKRDVQEVADMTGRSVATINRVKRTASISKYEKPRMNMMFINTGISQEIDDKFSRLYIYVAVLAISIALSLLSIVINK